jgi:hypothetical protein
MSLRPGRKAGSILGVDRSSADGMGSRRRRVPYQATSTSWVGTIMLMDARPGCLLWWMGTGKAQRLGDAD